MIKGDELSETSSFGILMLFPCEVVSIITGNYDRYCYPKDEQLAYIERMRPSV